MSDGEMGAKRLVRAKADGKIAGVCSGLADYFDVDPVLVRLAFILSLCLGGLGLVAYVVMWIMVPPGEATRPAATPGRLHLSAKDRKLAGVCGGLGEFFDIDPLIFRVAFVVMFFVWGTGVFGYLVLWLLMPRAESAITAAT
jgi:phage shock protein PspC (stress-responsive transcriptional regulator)